VSSIRDVELKIKSAALITLLLDQKVQEQVRELENAENPNRNCYPRHTVYSKKNLLLVPPTRGDERKEYRIPDFKRLHAVMAPSQSWPPSAPLHDDGRGGVLGRVPARPLKPAKMIPSNVSNLLDEDNYDNLPLAANPIKPKHTANAFDLFTGDQSIPFDDPFATVVGMHDVKSSSSVMDTTQLSAVGRRASANLFDPAVTTSLDPDADPFLCHSPMQSISPPSTARPSKVSSPVVTTSKHAVHDNIDPFATVLGSALQGISDPFANITFAPTPALPAVNHNSNHNDDDPFASVLSTAYSDPFASIAPIKPPKPPIGTPTSHGP
jgi:hypothetical protein